jgi:hypothetical protein
LRGRSGRATTPSGMTIAAATPPAQTVPQAGGSPPAGWEALRADGDVQLTPVAIPETPPPEPGWLEQALQNLLRWFAELLAPLGEVLGASWWWLQWMLAGCVGLFALVLLAQLLGKERGRRGNRAQADPEQEEWRPEAAASSALLEDADRLAAEGHFDAATRLLLHRSVGQIAAARPDWVEPSSTARELAALPALPDAARAAFGVIAARVEASAFALSPLARADWEAARAAYAEFALARIDGARLAA